MNDAQLKKCQLYWGCLAWCSHTGKLVFQILYQQVDVISPQGNMQRCKLVMDQVTEARDTMMKVLDHKEKVLKLLNKNGTVKKSSKLKRKERAWAPTPHQSMSHRRPPASLSVKRWRNCSEFWCYDLLHTIIHDHAPSPSAAQEQQEGFGEQELVLIQNRNIVGCHLMASAPPLFFLSLLSSF